MNQSHPSEEALAARILTHCLLGQSTSANRAHAIADAFTRLEQVMSEIIGSVGFRAVLARSVHQSRSRFPWLGTASAVEPPALTTAALTTGIERDGSASVEAGAAMVLGKVISLLCTFIGKDLTLCLLRRVWSDMELELGNLGRGSGTGVSDEQA